MSRMDFLIWVVVVARLTSPPDISLLYRGGQLVPVPDVTWFWYDDFLKEPSLYRLHLPYILGAAAVKNSVEAPPPRPSWNHHAVSSYSDLKYSFTVRGLMDWFFLVIVIRQACPGQHHKIRDLLTRCLSLRIWRKKFWFYRLIFINRYLITKGTCMRDHGSNDCINYQTERSKTGEI